MVELCHGAVPIQDGLKHRHHRIGTESMPLRNILDRLAAFRCQWLHDSLDLFVETRLASFHVAVQRTSGRWLKVHLTPVPDDAEPHHLVDGFGSFEHAESAARIAAR
jgi:hypothetical protein